jgi:hypothetical protein
MRNEAEKVQAIGVIGIIGEDAAIEPVCLTKPTGFMVSCRFRQG